MRCSIPLLLYSYPGLPIIGLLKLYEKVTSISSNEIASFRFPRKIFLIKKLSFKNSWKCVAKIFGIIGTTDEKRVVKVKVVGEKDKGK